VADVSGSGWDDVRTGRAWVAGATVRLPDGRELTLKDRIAHHTAAGLSTVEVAAANAGRIVEEFAAYFEKAQSEPQGRFKTYLIRRSNDEDALFDVMRFMEEQEIRYSVAERSQQVRGVVVGGMMGGLKGGASGDSKGGSKGGRDQRGREDLGARDGAGGRPSGECVSAKICDGAGVF
jgi:hypothetical protein